MNTSTESKNSILFSTLTEVFGDKMNLARIKFFGLFICALCKVQTVCFEKLAASFETDVGVGSSLRRIIQRFMADYLLDTNLIARLVFTLLPHEPPYRLAMDRTNWKFGSTNINILVLAIVYKGVAFPVLIKMMPKFGNSSTSERIEIMQRYFDLFGTESIDCLLADREFVGDHWLEFLNTNHVRYHIRIRDNFWVVIPRNKHRIKASWLFNSLKINQYVFIHRIVYVNGQLCYLSASKIKKHGRKAKSLFKYGLIFPANVLFTNDLDKFRERCKFLSCT